MLSLTKDQIFRRVAAAVNGEATAPTTTETDYGAWTEYLEEANQEWPLAYDFRVNEKTYQATAPASGTSLPAPNDVIKLLGFPEVDGSQYVQINAEDEAIHSNYFILKGNSRDGFYFKTSPLRGTGATFVTASVRYLATPTALATGSSVSPCPEPNFLVKRLTAKVLKQRGDSAFTLYDDEADLILARMIEQEVVQFTQFDHRTKSTFSTTGFTVGED